MGIAPDNAVYNILCWIDDDYVGQYNCRWDNGIVPLKFLMFHAFERANSFQTKRNCPPRQTKCNTQPAQGLHLLWKVTLKIFLLLFRILPIDFCIASCIIVPVLRQTSSLSLPAEHYIGGGSHQPSSPPVHGGMSCTNRIDVKRSQFKASASSFLI